ncbi:MAG: TetR/AcrR family transcriptional regulator [Anaerolineae bacterium]|nr:TetR/AcrR family transcriptional regulator [Anaerolineae bacterium]
MDERRRRTPRQVRSQEKVTRLLDSAAQVFAELGYEQATTNSIAARAGVSIGSLYQFFSDKEALLVALEERYVADLRAVVQQHLDPARSAQLTTAALLRQMVLAFAHFEMTHAAFRPLFMRERVAAAHALHAEIVSAVARLLHARGPALPAHEQQQNALICVGIVKGLMQLTDPPHHLAPEVVSEAIVTVLLAYIAALFRRAGLPPPPELA